MEGVSDFFCSFGTVFFRFMLVMLVMLGIWDSLLRCPVFCFCLFSFAFFFSVYITRVYLGTSLFMEF